MTRPKLALPLISLAFVLCSPALAAQSRDIEAFYADERSQKGLAQSVSSGQLRQGKERMVAACDQAKTKGEARAVDCDCFKTEVLNVSDRVFFHESVLAFSEYREKVEALKVDDQAKYQELNKEHAKRDGIFNRIKNTCQQE